MIIFSQSMAGVFWANCDFFHGEKFVPGNFSPRNEFSKSICFPHEINHLSFTPHSNKNKTRIIPIGANNTQTPYLHKAIIKANTNITPPKKFKPFIFIPPFLFIL